MTATAASSTVSTVDAHTDSRLDLSSLQCYMTFENSRMYYPAEKVKARYRVGSKFREPRLVTTQVQCNAQVVYRVFLADDTQPHPHTHSQCVQLDMCNQHFNEYFESHEIAANMVMRLSDDESDFVPAARRGRVRKRPQSLQSLSDPEPICQVPKRRVR